MRVLQFGRFYPPSRGGIECAIYNIREGLAARGVHCDVLCCNKGIASLREEAHNGTIYRAGFFGHLFSMPLSPGLFVRLWKIAANYDVIALHHPDPAATLALFLLRARARAKIIVHWHSDVVRQKTALRLFLPLQRWLLRRAGAVVVTSPAYARSRHLAAFRDKVSVAPIGIERRAPHSDAARVAAFRSRYANARLVFALGRLVYYKGFEYLVEAAARLDESFKVLIGGDGAYRRRLRKLIARRGLTNKVFLLGTLDADEVGVCYQACDVFCLPSVLPSEAFGIVQLEAMRAGKPVVATRLPGSGVAWVNFDRISGFNVAPRDPAALARALDVLAHNPELARRLGERGRRRFEDLFTRERMCARLHRIYRAAPGGGA